MIKKLDSVNKLKTSTNNCKWISEESLAYFLSVGVRRPASWLERLSLTEMASVKRSTAMSDLMRGWWQAYGRSVKVGRILSTRTDYILDSTLSSLGEVWTGRRTVGPKTSRRWLGRSWFQETTFFRVGKEGCDGGGGGGGRIKWYQFSGGVSCLI